MNNEWYERLTKPLRGSNGKIKKRWKILLVIVVLFSMMSCQMALDERGEKIDWPEAGLALRLPKPGSLRGTILDSDDYFSVNLKNVSKKEFIEYVQRCKDQGFKEYVVEDDDDDYVAYDKEDYKLDITYYESSESMGIKLDKPFEVTSIAWPSSQGAKLLPKPKVLKGIVHYDHEDSFNLTVGKISKDEYKDYVEACRKAGFTKDYTNNDNSYWADYKSYHLSLSFEPNEYMNIKLDKKEEVKEEKEPEKKEGVSQSFKDSMKEYEDFFDEYVDFMKKYKDEGNPIEMLADYTDMLTQYTDMMAEFENIEDDELSDEELTYYTKVQLRITEKLLEINE